MEANLVCCIDVLEHIEPPYLKNVLENLAKITINISFFTIHTGSAIKLLPDGRNTHLIQEPTSWWISLIGKHFEITKLEDSISGFWIVARTQANEQTEHSLIKIRSD